jgi:hypothetical protein
MDIFSVARALMENDRARITGGINAESLGVYPPHCWETVKAPPRARTATPPRRQRMDWSSWLVGMVMGGMIGFFIAALLAAAGRGSPHHGAHGSKRRGTALRTSPQKG